MRATRRKVNPVRQFLYHLSMQPRLRTPAPCRLKRDCRLSNLRPRLEPIAAKVFAGERWTLPTAWFSMALRTFSPWLAGQPRARSDACDVTYFQRQSPHQSTTSAWLRAKLCAFDQEGDPAGYTMALEEAFETAASGYSEAVTSSTSSAACIRPALRILPRSRRRPQAALPKVHIKAFTMVEVAFLARRAKLSMKKR